ncbi:substrate-binding periplasmic protein [Massilia sp. SM-13]|uniref:substrate-binding periplasmic protein n=1 Tax=Pseudoduganella rhizocola TaxID=3382643 RepID=UPI0038B6800F
MSFLKPAALAFCLAFALPTQAREPVRFAGEEWPPFVTPSLPEHGLSSAIMQAVFAKTGRSVQIDYFPWKRTMELGLHDPRYAGFLAVWRTPEREKLCHFSAPVGNTLTVIAHLRDTLVAADDVRDLANYRVGTVAGYANDERFEKLVQQKKIVVEEGVNDETNVRKLLMRRFPVIVIERRVLQYLLSSGRFSDADRVRIAINDTLFKERPVHLCFKRTPEGLALQRAFNEAARQLDTDKLERDYLRRIGADQGG